MGDAPSPPAAPDYAAANTAAVEADINTLPQRRTIEAQAKLGEGQFAGLGDADYSDAMAKSALDIQKKYGLDMVQNESDLVKAADPGRAAANDAFSKGVLDDYNLGSTLDDSTRREVSQATRSAQAARGNILGEAPAVDEIMALGNAGEARKQTRTANMQSYLGLTPTTGQYGAVNGATGPVPMESLASTVNPNAGQLGTQFASSVYGTEANIWQTQANIAQANSPMQLGVQLMGTAIGAASHM